MRKILVKKEAFESSGHCVAFHGWFADDPTCPPEEMFGVQQPKGHASFAAILDLDSFMDAIQSRIAFDLDISESPYIVCPIPLYVIESTYIDTEPDDLDRYLLAFHSKSPTDVDNGNTYFFDFDRNRARFWTQGQEAENAMNAIHRASSMQESLRLIRVG